MGPLKFGRLASHNFTPILIIILCIVLGQHQIDAQRSLHHWRRDLEHRLRSYQENRNIINNIISSSIYPLDEKLPPARGPVRISSRADVRFSDLIIPDGSLILAPALAQSAAQFLAAKTRQFLEAKETELRRVQIQVQDLRRQLDTSPYIHKQFIPGVRYNQTRRPIFGEKVFERVSYVRLIDSPQVSLGSVNGTDVSRVIDDTYLRNAKFTVRDSKGRPYFEGRKIFWDTVFQHELESGCCGRLKPVDTSRVMLRSMDQLVRAPVLIQSGSQLVNGAVLIRQLSTERLYNKQLELNPRLPPASVRLPPGDIGLMPAGPPENFIMLTNLIYTRQLDHAELTKTIIFQSPVSIDEALLSSSYADGRLAIGILSMPGFLFDLSLDNYLLRYLNHPLGKNSSVPYVMQHVPGRFVVQGAVNLPGGIETQVVNGIGNIRQFLLDSIVNVNRPTIVFGPVQFNALPAMLTASRPPTPLNPSTGLPMGARPSPNVLIMRVRPHLELGSVNGMRLPSDIVILPNRLAPGEQNARLALKPYQVVSVRGPRHFANALVFKNFLDVNGTVNDIPMPDGVIPLHLNDFINTAGHSNLWFMDGISLPHLTTHSNQFDQIQLSDVNGDAQSLLMRSMLVEQPDGSSLIRAPLRILNLNLIQTGPNVGLINGFRPQEVLELAPRYPYETSIHGRRTFLSPVEATDCVFQDINQIANWTSQLIRVDRPNTVQTIHTRLAFSSPTNNYNNQRQNYSRAGGSLNVDRLSVEFYPENDPMNYHRNWNFSPELYLLHQALTRSLVNSTGGRYRVNHVRLIHPSGGLVNGVPLHDIVTLDKPFRFADRFTMVGKVEVETRLTAGRIQSNYPLDAMDLVQFDKYRIPITSRNRKPIQLGNLVLGQNNRASSVRCQLLNGVPFSEFASSIMSLTRPQDVYSNVEFMAPVGFEAHFRTRSSLNGVKNFAHFANQIKQAKYLFDDGLQCNAVVVRN